MLSTSSHTRTSTYEIFTQPQIYLVPMMICVNKIDLAGARSEEQVVEDLEREIERMRTSRGAALEGEDAAETYLGIDGQQFELSHAPTNVDVTSISAEKGDIDGAIDFLQQHFYVDFV
eukprot:GEMP01082991.1.p1 GENE.GEMP01082991.1~~GEMP01082991.1.p1  ORF type:complete len:118 (+),score=22.98 GEMP01082991.1:348-701(+)